MDLFILMTSLCLSFSNGLDWPMNLLPLLVTLQMWPCKLKVQNSSKGETTRDKKMILSLDTVVVRCFHLWSLKTDQNLSHLQNISHDVTSEVPNMPVLKLYKRIHKIYIQKPKFRMDFVTNCHGDVISGSTLLCLSLLMNIWNLRQLTGSARFTLLHITPGWEWDCDSILLTFWHTQIRHSPVNKHLSTTDQTIL